MNRMACLRLTERCADILYGVQEEIVDAGLQVAGELHDPIAKLVECVLLPISHPASRPKLTWRAQVVRTGVLLPD